MEIAVIGISYKEADVDLRGEAAFTTALKHEASRQLAEAGVPEFMILSTCNRSEIYFATQHMARDVETVRKVYLSMAGAKIGPYLFVKKFEMALQHLYQVAAGLDSLVLGEDEILGQLKDAWDFAREQGSSRKHLNKAVRESVTFSKKVRNAYKLSENQLSVAAIGVRYLKERCPDLSDKSVLLVGTGAMGQLVLRYLEEEGTGTIYLTNRTMHKEQVELFLGRKVKLIEYEERYACLDKADAVISATASPHTIFRADQMPPLKKEMLFLDMAVPRDIDRAIDRLPLAEVVTLDTFTAIVESHRKARLETAQQINRLILEEVRELESWLLRSKIDYVVRGFHSRQAAVIAKAREQLEKLDLSAEQEEAVMASLKSSTWQMIKEPVSRLKEIRKVEDLEQYKMMIEGLFDFDKEEL